MTKFKWIVYALIFFWALVDLIIVLNLKNELNKLENEKKESIIIRVVEKNCTIIPNTKML